MTKHIIITVEEVFDIYSCLDKKGQTIWRIKFKNGYQLPYMSTNKNTVYSYAYKYIYKNKKEVIDMIFEKEFL